ncbi:MAG: amidohydrolase family protein [Trueperaceae bacterium]|nr:MAG: amidohydrolase family protein [Trueperaceae bacterium]
MKVKIQGGFVVGYREGHHELLEGGCVVYEGSEILFVGFPDDPACPAADRVISAPGKLVSPGLINLHCIANIDLQPLRIDVAGGGYLRDKAWFEGEEHIFDAADFETSARFSVAALLRHGSTTFCNVTTMASKRFDDPEIEPRLLAEAAAELGARAYLAHNFQDHSRYHHSDGSAEVVHDAAAGRRGLERAVRLVEELRDLGEERIAGFLFPYTTQTCSDPLLKEASRVGRELGVPIRSHFAQYLYEAEETLAKRGLSPVERLAELGVLGPELTLTHAIYIRGHPQVGGEMDGDLSLLADSGTHVAHCPVVFSRRGELLRSFQRYLDAGINLALGTDTVPPDLVAEMRMASTLSKVADDDAESGSAAAVFDAATLGGARALGRDDLGRLEPGAKADISVFNLHALHIGVVDDPIKALVHYGNGVDTETVIVGGRTVVENGHVLGTSEFELLDTAQQAWQRYKKGLIAREPGSRRGEELYPRSFPWRQR